MAKKLKPTFLKRLTARLIRAEYATQPCRWTPTTLKQPTSCILCNRVVQKGREAWHTRDVSTGGVRVCLRCWKPVAPPPKEEF